MTDARLRGTTLTLWPLGVWPMPSRGGEQSSCGLLKFTLLKSRWLRWALWALKGRDTMPPPMAQTQGYSFKTHASPPSSLNIALPPWNPPTIPFLIRLLPPSVIMLRPIYVVAGVSNLLLFPGSVSSYTIICLPILLLLNIWLAYNFWLLQTKLPWTFTFCMNIFFLLGKYIGMKWLGHVIGVCLTF